MFSSRSCISNSSSSIDPNFLENSLLTIFLYEIVSGNKFREGLDYGAIVETMGVSAIVESLKSLLKGSSSCITNLSGGDTIPIEGKRTINKGKNETRRNRKSTIFFLSAPTNQVPNPRVRNLNQDQRNPLEEDKSHC